MYNPGHYRVTGRSKLIEIIKQYPLGMLVSNLNGHVHVSHIPFVVDDSFTQLSGHMALANSQWKGLDGSNVTVVFNGPNHYISPTWYGPSYTVPTWNYVSVHASGTYSEVKDEGEKMKVLDTLTSIFESQYGENWKPEWSDQKYSGMLKSIVAFHIQVTEVEGIWKLSQGHKTENRMNVAFRLRKIGTCNANSIASLMEESTEN